ncbi:MAG: homoserine O-acetyltransferase [Burkholderiaceae bacterium]
MRKRWIRALLCAVCMTVASLAQGYDGMVEKKVFTIPSFTTVGGKTIRNVRIGYETYGTLNAAGTNAIFVAHYFSGNSHAAGKYKAADAAAGYWDSVIGAGKPFDTDRYFVVSADSLVNLSTKDPNVVTTGPATIDPDTGKSYGMRFPIVTIKDFVVTQKALADSLGIKRFAAVTGASMGSLQAMEWATSYPDMVERVIPVIPGGLEANPYLIAVADEWAMPIYDDPKWNGGDYYGKDEPVHGMAEALKLVTISSRAPGWAQKTFARDWAVEGADPLASWDNKYKVQAVLDKAGAARAPTADANSFLYLVRANQLYRVGQGATLEEGVAKIRARVLAIPAASDRLLFPEYTTTMLDTLKKQGVTTELFVIQGDGGHLDGVLDIAKAGDAIRAFLAK